MKAAIKPMYVRGLLRSEEEIADAIPVIGELTTYFAPREPGEKPRHIANIVADDATVRPMIEPRLIAIGARSYKLRGLEEIETDGRVEYRLQEWVVEEAPRHR